MYFIRKLKRWKWKLIVLILFLLIFLYYFQTSTKGIAILVVITNDTNPEEYKIALKSVECYARIQEYHFVLVRDSGPDSSEYQCRHCILSRILQNFDAILFLDADVGVVNPNRRIEEFMEDGVDLTFYDRFQNLEIATGSYIARNTKYAVGFLNEFANYELKLPDSLHGSDNGAIHMFLAEKLLPNSKISESNCLKVYENSKSYDDLFTFEACIRNLFGSKTRFEKVRIMKKGNGWIRDGWLSGSQWHPDLDFMLHGWKMSQLRKTPNWRIKPIPTSRNQWYNPFAGSFDLEKCTPKNKTWIYDIRLQGNKEEIQRSLKKIESEVIVMQSKSFARIQEILQLNFERK